MIILITLLVKSRWCYLSCDSDLQPSGYEAYELPLLHINLTKTDISYQGFIPLSVDLILTQLTGNSAQGDQSNKASYQDLFQHTRVIGEDA